jgi:hypothetical protein
MALLKTHMAADVVLIQKMPWANFKCIVSSTSKNSDVVSGTVRHALFVCIRDTATSIVCFYVNKRILHLSPVTEKITGLDENNTLVLTLTLDEGKSQVQIVNVYNHSKNMSAIHNIIDNEDILPRIDLCIGDFNMHHPL